MICALVIDDYPAMQRVIRRALAEMFGYDIVISAVDNARDAISLLGEIKFDLIVSDYNLGDSTGGEILEYLKKHQPDQVERFVFFAGSTQARSLHDKVIDKDDALRFSELITNMMNGVPMPRSERRKP